MNRRRYRLALVAAASLLLTGARLVPGIKGSCVWQPERLEVACRAESYGQYLPNWEVTDTATGELLHVARGAYVRLTLSETRWRDVTVWTEERGLAKMRMRWTPSGRLEELPIEGK